MTGPLRLPRRGGELLLRILEQSRPAIAASVLQDLPSGLPAELIKLGALERNGASRAALLPGDDDGPAFRDLTWQADRNSYGYFDAFDGNVVLTPESQMLYRVALPWWLAWLAASLKLTNSGQPAELVRTSAWDIGDLWITRQRNVPVLFVRRLHRDVTSKALREALHKRAGRSGGLVLTSGRGLSQDSIERFVVVPIANILTNDSQVFSIDRKLLLSPFMAAGTTAAPTQPIHLSPDGRRITINGTVTLDFKSDIQVKLIRRLVDGHKEGKRLRAQELLNDAGSSVTTLARAFGGKKWKQLEPYLTSKNGLWGFDL